MTWLWTLFLALPGLLCCFCIFLFLHVVSPPSSSLVLPASPSLSFSVWRTCLMVSMPSDDHVCRCGITKGDMTGHCPKRFLEGDDSRHED